VFEKKMLRRIFGPKGDEVIGGWRKMRNKELHNFYYSPGVTTIIKSRRIKWVRRVARKVRRGVHEGY
jgi:hypothetical protein